MKVSFSNSIKIVFVCALNDFITIVLQMNSDEHSPASAYKVVASEFQV